MDALEDCHVVDALITRKIGDPHRSSQRGGGPPGGPLTERFSQGPSLLRSAGGRGGEASGAQGLTLNHPRGRVGAAVSAAETQPETSLSLPLRVSA